VMLRPLLAPRGLGSCCRYFVDGSRNESKVSASDQQAERNDEAVGGADGLQWTLFSFSTPSLREEITRDMIIYENFISSDEEQLLLKELEPYMKKLRYEFDHWDDAIHGYRETEKHVWNDDNKKILDRIKNLAFPPDAVPLQHIHVLDIAKEGYIKPHVDSVRFCGNVITGLSLLSTAVMRLVHEKEPHLRADVLLPQKSLYIMRDAVRFNYTHEILKDEDSWHRGRHIKRDRRISIMCRNEPSKE